MKQLNLMIVLCLLCNAVLQAQTWNGSLSTNWNTAGNWTPNTVPTGTSNVTIPGSLTVYPQLTVNTTINGIVMNSGSQLDVNGFELSLNGVNIYNYFTGATLNNSSAATTDIVINLNANGGGYTHYFRSNTVNDAIIFNLTGSDAFYEGDVAPANQFNGNATYNINGTMPVNIANATASQYNGDLIVNRTVGGSTSMFATGATVAGNFMLTNNAGGAIGMGNTTNTTNISGTINIACNYPSPFTFDMYNITNQTTGGIINIQNSRGIFLQKDTLKVTSLSVIGFSGNAYGQIYNNSVTGNVTFADDASYSGGYNTHFRSNLFTGTTTISNNGSNTMIDADVANSGSHYVGNTIFNCGGGPVYISHAGLSQFDGNLTINRTAAGFTQAFNSGSIINGNLAYTNNTAGNTYFGNPANRTSISGTINMNANYSAVNVFEMFRLINQTNGGSINIQNSQGFNVQNDTLKVTSFSITNYTGNTYGYLYNNNLTANVTITSADTYVGGYATYIHNNSITGNTTFTNKSINVFYEADALNSSNHFIGNTVFNAAGSGTFVVSHADTSQFDGNVTFNRTVAGITYVFYNGGIVNGNFAYSNNAAGNTYLGSTAIKTTISGTVNIVANYTTPDLFVMYRLINQTGGGAISVVNSQGFNVQKDTLKVVSLSITGYRGSAYAYFFNNDITGNVTTADDASYGGGYTTILRSNVITGSSNFSNNGTNPFYDADGVGDDNKYVGNVVYNCAGGPTYIAHGAPMQCTGNVNVTRTVANTTYVFNAGSSVSGNFTYTNITAGNTYLGNINFKTTIGGTVNVSASYTTPNIFSLNRLINQTGGGKINVLNSQGYSIQSDTLIVDSLNLTGYRANQYAYFLNNNIKGNVTTADDASYSGGYATFLRSNIITGNTSIANNGTNVLHDADGTGDGNKYIGNVTYIRTNGSISVGAGDTVEISQNLSLNALTGIALGKIKFNGSTNGIVKQLGTQPINISLLIMEKTGTGKLTLNDSVTVTNTATFTSGNMISSTANNLIFPNNISYTGASVSSHVVGTVTKIGDNVFTFPVGGLGTYNPVTMSAPSGATSKFSAEFKAQNPTIDGYNTNSKAGSFGSAIISNAGYWDVQRLAGTTNVTLSLGFNANPYEQYPVLANLKVAHWTGTQWDDNGNGGTTGTPASGTVVNSVPITSFSPFAIAGIVPTYFFSATNPGAGPDGTPFKIKGIKGFPAYMVKPLPGGTYTPDSIFLVPNGGTASFRIKDLYGVEKDTTVTASVAPTSYISSNGNGTKTFGGWRHFVYMTDASNNIMGAIKDNDLTLGTTVMNTYFSTANVATSPNGNTYLKRSFKITTALNATGTKRVRFYITKTEFNNLVAATPTAFPLGISSLTITKYTGAQEDSLFNPIPGGNAVIIPNSAITIADLGTMYSLDVNVTGFSGFYIGGNNSNINVCSGSTISLPSNISGTTYQWQRSTGGNNFSNISNSGGYSGVSTNLLTITNSGGSFYGYKFRVLVDGTTYSQIYTLKYNTLWQGTADTNWSNPANWSCGQLPDANTDVIVNNGKSNYPILNLNASIRTLTVKPGATATIGTGFNLTITK